MYPPNAENMSFTFCAFLDSWGNQVLLYGTNSASSQTCPLGCQKAMLVRPADIPNKYRLKNALLTNHHSHMPVLVGTVWTCFLYISPCYCNYYLCTHLIFPCYPLAFFWVISLGL